MDVFQYLIRWYLYTKNILKQRYSILTIKGSHLQYCFYLAAICSALQHGDIVVGAIWYWTIPNPIQSGAVITRPNMSWYYISHYNAAEHTLDFEFTKKKTRARFGVSILRIFSTLTALWRHRNVLFYCGYAWDMRSLPRENDIILMKWSPQIGTWMCNYTVKSLIWVAPSPKIWMFLVSSCICLCPIH